MNLSSRYPQNANTASGITVDTSAFSSNLGSSDDDVQKSLETLDQLSASGGGSTSYFIDAGSFSYPATDPAINGSTTLSTNNTIVDYADFFNTSAGTEYQAQCKFVLPNNYDGNGISIKVLYGPDETDGSGVVAFGFRTKAIVPGNSLDASWSTQEVIEDTFNSSLAIGDYELTPASGTVTYQSAHSASDLIFIELSILPGYSSWTYDQDIRVYGIEVNYTAV